MKKILPVALVLFLGAVAFAEAAEQAVVMKIEGMTCELCAIAIKKSLKGVPGVRNVKVSYAEKKAWVTVDKSVTDDALIDAVRKAGEYEGKVIERK
jgi:mercuric ion binding protein